MKRFYISRLIILVSILLRLSSSVDAQTLVYNQSFSNGVTPSTQCTAWTTFLASLLASYNYTGFNVSGSLNTTGYTCTSATVAAAVALAMRTGVATTQTSDGHTWYVGTGCGTGCGGPIVELSVDQVACQCSGGVASVRPAIANDNWGGISAAGLGCPPPTQTMIVTFFYQALLFTTASPASLPSVCENSGGTLLNSILSTTDPTVGITETWSQNVAPVHGSLGGFPVTGTTTAGTLTPTGSLTYTPAAGYSGIDSFKIQAIAGTTTAIMSVHVTVNATPAPISGISCVVQGQTSALGDAPASGVWSSNNTTVASVTSGGIVTGATLGTATISYLVGAICPQTTIVTVSATPVAISSPSSICTGTVTTLTDASTGGGIWSSSNPANATVDAFGNVTGVAIGGTTITYALPSTCIATKTLTVNNSPGAIGGTATVCQGATMSLSDVPGGGVWASASPGIANVDTAGHVTGVGTAGMVVSTNIIYTLSNGCSAIKAVTVNPLPQAYLVGGNSTYCVGNSPTIPIILSNSATGISYQLYNGPSPVGPALPGTGSGFSFGVPTAPGVYTVIATNGATSCTNTMTLSATVTPKALPLQFTVSGGGNYCQGGSGVIDSLNGSSTGVSYQLYNDGAPLLGATITGTGGPIYFLPQTLSGVYTVVASTTGAAPVCSSNMIGSASITINPLPTPENVTGGGSYCAGGPGVPIGLEFSSTGIYYVLFNGSTPIDTVTGTGDAISFGSQTAPSSSYIVIGTNITTQCTNNMTGTASVNIATPPMAYIVTGGGTDCAGTNFPIGLENSDLGVNYQLYNGGAPVGGPVAGVPGALSFGIFDVAGTYSVIATDQTYFCTSNMSNTVTITENPLPTVYNVTGGGNYCFGGAGLPVMLSGSQSNVIYYLYDGPTLIGPLPGTGGPLNFGVQPLGGNYTVVAVFNGTNCTSNMAGSATITIDPLPNPYNVTGGGNYCAGGAGIDLGLYFSTTGVNYQLFISGTATGAPVPGTGTTLDFGYHTASGIYTVVATNPATTCQLNMAGSATIVINPLPGLHTVSGGGSYCAGDAGRPVSIPGSDTGIAYQLYNNVTTAIGTPAAGTGSSINFGLQTLAGTYTVIATNTTTLCTRNMPGVATVVVNPIPNAFNVTGGGIFCEGGAGEHIGLSGSNTGVHYLLYNASTLESTVTGSGSTVDFGLETVPGTYTVTATNTATGCSNTMSGNAVIDTNAAPSVYSVIGGGSYCNGSATIPSVGLSSSNSGINYQLYLGGAAIGATIPGTGAAIDFGTEPLSGIYTVVATDATAGCPKNMTGSATVSINALPNVYTVTGGGNYCAGGTGYHIYMSNSNTGIQYQLFNGSAPVDTVPGTGAGVDFGLQSLAGTYTAMAMNTVTGCTSNMAGSAVININSLPAAHTVTVADGGNYCVTGSGVHVGLNGSNTGISYQLNNGTAHAGTAMSGTGSPIDFGIHAAGNYTVVATNASTGCTSNMTGSGMVTAIPLPNVYALTGGGNYCTTGLGLHVGLSGSDAGTAYQLYKGTTATGIPVTGTGGSIDFGLYTGAGSYTVVGSNGGALGCNDNMSGSAVITVYPVVIPTVNIATAGGDTICEGNTANFTASTINGGTAPTYSWSVNGVPTAAGGTFSYAPVDGDMVNVFVISNGICAIPDTASQTIRLTVSPPELPSAHVTAVPGDVVCQGTTVTYSATTLYAGFNPTYTWLKNGATVAASGLSYTYIPLNNDIIVLMMTSSFPCRISDTVFSNPNTMKVDPPLIPIVTIKATPGTVISAGENVTLTATVIYGGSAPTYQWEINGIPVNGATNTTFTSSNFSENDSVTCVIVGACDLKGFNSVRVHLTNEGVQQITASGSDNIKLVPNPNKGVFTIKGTLGASDEKISIEVTNMLGQVVYSSEATVQNGVINKEIQLNSSLANGMYLLNLRSGSQNNVFHFVIEQ